MRFARERLRWAKWRQMISDQIFRFSLVCCMLMFRLYRSGVHRSNIAFLDWIHANLTKMRRKLQAKMCLKRNRQIEPSMKAIFGKNNVTLFTCRLACGVHGHMVRVRMDTTNYLHDSQGRQYFLSFHNLELEPRIGHRLTNWQFVQS